MLLLEVFVLNLAGPASDCSSVMVMSLNPFLFTADLSFATYDDFQKELWVSEFFFFSLEGPDKH
jgi:hypothetical protein